MKKRNQTLIVLDDNYTNNCTPILVKCDICGNEWKSRPGNLLTGNGCPICARKKNAEKSRLTHEQFLERMKQKGLYTTDASAICKRVEESGLSQIFARCLV